jgi:putative transposase
MDGKGRATDVITIERFWRSAKYENIYIQEFKTIKEIKSAMCEDIDFYNHKRCHQTFNY